MKRQSRHSRPKGGRHKRRKRSTFVRVGRNDSATDTTYHERPGKKYDVKSGGPKKV